MRTYFSWRRWMISFVFVLLVSLQPISAQCVDDNDFTIGEAVDVCTAGCIYEDSDNFGAYLPCDSSVECRFTAFYPNRTLIVSSEDMSLNGSIFNYSFGKFPFANLSGIFTATISCNRGLGWEDVASFPWSISAVDSPIVTSGGRASSTSFSDTELGREFIDFKKNASKELKKNRTFWLISIALGLTTFLLIWRGRGVRKEKRIGDNIAKRFKLKKVKK